MGLLATPSGERVHIGFFGVRNAGKSSVVNAVTGQDLAVVSNVAGTTTDPVSKAMELLPLGPVVIVDTPGMDDEGGLGELRVRKARQALRRCDVAVLVVDATRGLTQADRMLLDEFSDRRLPYLVALNKADLLKGDAPELAPNEVLVSAREGSGIHELKERLGALAADAGHRRLIVSDLLEEGDVVVLVCPIDASAPKGRLILPQQLVLRDVIDAHASALVCQPAELAGVLEQLARPPRVVITDSQAFGEVARIVPRDVALTSFSILMARYKGNLPALVEGAKRLSSLADDSRVLIAEGCTHHRQCEDIGTVKMPAWIRQHCGASPEFSFTSGGEFPDDLSAYDLVVHCGGCMLNEREMAHRMATATAAGVPMVNYGVAIAQMHGILARSLEPFATVTNA
ncbi:MAG: [FeFe] hydrogenase H-cluster maturation GTPase HydF [Coriobacteriales bacterium]|nr:[FeFe] hydrogenase H-cluster maturation GTPase HydF [Coriobacteriales bacterium]